MTQKTDTIRYNCHTLTEEHITNTLPKDYDGDCCVGCQGRKRPYHTLVFVDGSEGCCEACKNCWMPIYCVCWTTFACSLLIWDCSTASICGNITNVIFYPFRIFLAILFLLLAWTVFLAFDMLINFPLLLSGCCCCKLKVKKAKKVKALVGCGGACFICTSTVLEDEENCSPCVKMIDVTDGTAKLWDNAMQRRLM